ncbi:glycosyltransferase family 4 protein [Candidatus Woesebacteria bacterium]|nr:glycosyltransferase family 4 protein [Candidatus Woesebacteria bacterium]
MKIGLLHYTYPPIIGGVENIVKLQADSLAKMNHQVVVFSSNILQGRTSLENISFVQIPELASLKKNFLLYQKIMDSKEYPKEIFIMIEKILSTIQKHSNLFDVLIAHNIFSLPFNPAIGEALLKFASDSPRKKIIAWTHDVILKDREVNPTVIAYQNKQLNDLVNTYHPQLHYIAISNYLKKTLTNVLLFPNNKITVVPNGLNVLSFLNIHPSLHEIVYKNNLLLANPLLYFPAKIMPHKHFEIALTILEGLKRKKQYNPMLLISAKTYPHKQSAIDYVNNVKKEIDKKGLKNNVIFLENIFDNLKIDEIMNVIHDCYSLSDLILYPSSYENFGLPIIEAGITKTPILCTDLDVYKEIAYEYIYKLNSLSSPSQIVALVERILKSTQSRYFRKIKNAFDYRFIIQTQIEPYLKSL